MWKYNIVKTGKFIVVSSFVLLYCILIQPKQTEGAEISWQEPKELQKEIKGRLQDIKISSDDEKQIENKLENINLKFSNENDKIVKFFKEMDKKAIPKIEKTLRSEDINLKEKSLFALGCLLKAPEHRKEDDKRTEETLTLILIRSLKDKEATIRGHATSILGRIAYWSGWPGPRPNPAPIVVEALKAMLKDEDDSVRKSAAFALFRIGREADVPEELRKEFEGLIID